MSTLNIKEIRFKGEPLCPKNIETLQEVFDYLEWTEQVNLDSVKNKYDSKAATVNTHYDGSYAVGEILNGISTLTSEMFKHLSSLEWINNKRPLDWRQGLEWAVMYKMATLAPSNLDFICRPNSAHKDEYKELGFSELEIIVS